MSKFSIIPNGGGTARYSGCPSFTGTYMKPGMLEFREIASPTPIDWSVGDYVVYTRTGFTYRLYGIPQVKKQARSTEYGGAFVYQGVQFFDDTKQLEICPFRDLVPDDNRIHFSTQPSISTFEAVDGIARRIQACLDDMYPNKWIVQLATVAMGASADLVALMEEAREFTVSGVSLLGALDHVYEVWQDVGWTFSVDSVSGKNVITIGGAGLSSTASYEYGKGNGLTSITRIVANADEMATRIFAYGSSRNMLPRWYNSQTIKDAESVDIQNLMIPVTEWGETEVEGVMLPDPAKAYIDADGTTMARLGLRPKTYYFDGTGDLPEIYPSIREMTIGAVRTALGSSSAQYYPSTSVYTDATARVDQVLSVSTVFDDGLAGEEGKAASVSSSESLGGMSGSGSVNASSTERIVILAQKSFTMTKTRRTDISVSASGSGSVSTNGGVGSVSLLLSIQKGDGTNFTEIKRSTVQMPADGSGNFAMRFIGASISDVEVTVGDVIRFYVSVYVQNPSSSSLSYTYSISPKYSFSAALNRAKTFTISLRQLGFDINEQADLGEGKTIAMRTGKCAGRSFTIQSCSYVQSTDSWSLEVIRSQDDSLSQWFPNTDYPVVAGDEFVLLDIAMPDVYVSVAEQRLLAATQELLADVSVERWQYTPEIDAKFMVENSRVILPAQLMVLTDSDIVDGSPAESILIDTVTINEGEAAIPTYKVTLRDRKKKTFTEAKSADGMTSNPVTNSTQESIQQMASQGGDSFFELDESGNVTLKSQYQNLWVPGFLSGGGKNGSGGGGGGGSVSFLDDLTDVNAPSPSDGDLLAWDNATSKWVNIAQSSITPDLTGYATQSWVQSQGYLTSSSLSGYVPTSRKVNGHALSSDVTVTKGDLCLGNVENTALSTWAGSTNITTLGTIATGSIPLSLVTGASDLKTIEALTGTSGILRKTAANTWSLDTTTYATQTNLALVSERVDRFEAMFEIVDGNVHVKNNYGFYADSFLTAGGVGSGSGGGGVMSYLDDLLDVTAPTPVNGDLLYWDGSSWTNVNYASLLDSKDFVIVTSLPTASSSTMNHIYLVGPDSSNNYNRYITQLSGGTYSWAPVGSTQIDLSDYVLSSVFAPVKQEVEKLDQVTDLVDNSGFYVTDTYNRIGLKYDGDGLDAAKVSEHFIQLLEEAGISGGGSFSGHAIEVEETGFFFVDMSLNIGVKIDADGISAKNILEYDIL